MSSIRIILSWILVIMLVSCKENKNLSNNNSFFITTSQQQDNLFTSLISLTDNEISTHLQQDSLVFLLLPIEAACPSCRKKIIDNIVKYKSEIRDKHFVIISGMGRNKIESYFENQNHKLPTAEGRIFIDSVNNAFINELIYSKPTIYYSFKKKVYRKTTCVPDNIKEELRKFFSSDN